MTNSLCPPHSPAVKDTRYRRHILALLMAVLFATTVCDDTPSAQASVSSIPTSEQTSSAPDPFAKGSREWSVTTGVSHRETIAWMYITQLDIRHYLLDNLAVNYGCILGYADAQRTPGGVLGGPEVGLRWHLVKGKRWSGYLEALAGAVYEQNPLSPHSLRFDFDLQGGGGATYSLRRDLMIQGGVRWHHLSNARVRGKKHNFGYDALMLYIGLTRSF